MLSAVYKISAPNDKVRLVNELTRKVARLDQIQKSGMLNKRGNTVGFFKETKKLILSIDTLESLFSGNDKQVKRINSLKRLLIERDILFINYLRVRQGLVNNKSFSSQVKMLNGLLTESALQSDSITTTTEKKTSTTTVIPADTTDSTKESRGFFSKLFGKKKQQVITAPYKVVNEEFRINHNQHAKAIQDSIINGMGETMRKLEKGQLRRSSIFVNREASLNAANNKLILRILSILKQVEAEAVTQVGVNNNTAKNVINKSVGRLSYIIIAFFLLTILLIYLILKDISRSNRYRKEIELARDEAEYHGQAKHRFLSNMSHEIRTPLQSIIGYAELMMQQEHPRKSDIDAIYQSSEHLMQVVNEVLDYNRIISGKFTFTNQVFSMLKLLNEVVSIMSFQAVAKSIQLVTDYDTVQENYVEGDPFRLKQILFNILGNAIKFTDSGEVKLSVLYTRDVDLLQYTFIINDTGIGLSDTDIRRIFNEFEQAKKTDSDHLTGTGLGLTISKALIEAQGGTIDVKSKLREGSTFTFSLQFKEGIPKVSNAEVTSEANNNLRFPKVWIIDDDNFILELCSIIFHKNGIAYQCFNSPADALDTIFDLPVKQIFLDIRMPGMSGFRLCELLRKKIPKDVLIYALTAQVLPDEHQLILKQGFDGILMKPFKERDLLSLVTPLPDNTKINNVISLDISKIEAMTFGDKQQLNKILKRFTEDCIDDIANIRLSIGDYDNEKIVLLLHRIAGRTAQVGAADLAAEFRAAEIDFFKNDLVDTEKLNTIIVLTDKLQILIKEVRMVYLGDIIGETIVD